MHDLLDEIKRMLEMKEQKNLVAGSRRTIHLGRRATETTSPETGSVNGKHGIAPVT